jgi:hypothetical protein
MDSWTITAEIGPVGSSRKGNPYRPIRTDKQIPINLNGELPMLEQLQPGVKIRISEPKKFGRDVWATLYEIEQSKGYASNQNPQQLVQKPAQKPPEPPILGGLQAQGAPTWEEYKRVAYAAQDLAMQLESDIPCDPKTNDQYINNSMARAAIVQSILVAFRDGKVQAPKEKDSGQDAPIPKDEGFPWERAS